VAVMTLDGGESGGKRALSADAVSACQFFWAIKACASQRSIMRLGLEPVRNSWRLTFDAPGELTNRNKGYTPGTRGNACV
jgi:hypothetical protein